MPPDDFEGFVVETMTGTIKLHNPIESGVVLVIKKVNDLPMHAPIALGPGEEITLVAESLSFVEIEKEFAYDEF